MSLKETSEEVLKYLSEKFPEKKLEIMYSHDPYNFTPIITLISDGTSIIEHRSGGKTPGMIARYLEKEILNLK